MRILVTGGSGFIGSAFVRDAVGTWGWSVLNLDKLTYAAAPEAVREIESSRHYQFLQADLCDRETLDRILAEFFPEAIVHLAAETHVDRSISGTEPFLSSNIIGTWTLLEAALAYYRTCSPEAAAAFRFLHVSTDEVFGSLPLTGSNAFTTDSPYRPRNPYSASKAAGDFLVQAWYHTFGLPVLLTHCTNNYGPWQHEEKLIPHTIACALAGQPISVYGHGENVRDWIHVDDHVRALRHVLDKGQLGESYNIGARNEWRNLDLVREICRILDEESPRPMGTYADLITMTDDRPGHDLRYAMDPIRMETELGWHPEVVFSEGLRQTVIWYLQRYTP